MSKRTRRQYTPDQKAALVRQHVVDKKPVSEICSAAQLQPSVFYKWERDLLEAAPAVFAGARTPCPSSSALAPSDPAGPPRRAPDTWSAGHARGELGRHRPREVLRLAAAVR
jgi:transposase-like protein